MRINERIKKLENQSSPLDWSKVKIYDWSSTPENLRNWHDKKQPEKQ